MKVAEGGIPSNNNIVDAMVTETLERSEKVEEAKVKLDWVGEWTMTEDRWC
jgi:metal-sulfur cluster biosynthetic enzyme